MTGRILRCLLPVAGIALASAAIAAPPPPPPPGTIERATAIVTVPAADHLPAYGDLFADDVAVFEKSRLVASGRAAWLAWLKPRLALNVKRLEISYGNPIISVEDVNNMRWIGPGVVVDCCFWARVVTYRLRDDGKVDEVRFIENGTPWDSSDKPRR